MVAAGDAQVRGGAVQAELQPRGVALGEDVDEGLGNAQLEGNRRHSCWA